MEKVYGAILYQGQYCPVIALADVDNEPTEDFEWAEKLVFEMNGRKLWLNIEDTTQLLVGLQ